MFVTWDLGGGGDCAKQDCRLGEEPLGAGIPMLTKLKKGGGLSSQSTTPSEGQGVGGVQGLELSEEEQS